MTFNLQDQGPPLSRSEIDQIALSYGFVLHPSHVDFLLKHGNGGYLTEYLCVPVKDCESEPEFHLRQLHGIAHPTEYLNLEKTLVGYGIDNQLPARLLPIFEDDGGSQLCYRWDPWDDHHIVYWCPDGGDPWMTFPVAKDFDDLEAKMFLSYEGHGLEGGDDIELPKPLPVLRDPSERIEVLSLGDGGPQLAKEEMRQIAIAQGFVMHDSHLEYLAKQGNGGELQPYLMVRVPKFEGGFDCHIHVLLAMRHPKKMLDLSYAMEVYTYSNQLPGRVIPIFSCEGNDQICFRWFPDDGNQIVFWRERNEHHHLTYPIARDFEEFHSMLRYAE